ncbi:MAG: hypothetical protein EAZ57_01130 [Cytophagales bacterium]|nr:MAG: hypothetical protein EAZ67_02145 [Cytophagales bacterium]TAF62053.1 MAG: hypothetical protein EAZ57_01130 [Cytophagales bacterium]
MVLNYIWVAFFVGAFLAALFQYFVQGDAGIFSQLVTALIESSKTGFEIAIGLTGLMVFWLGLMQIGLQAGIINTIARWVSPFFVKLFPEVPPNHPAMGSMIMNFAANMLGLDNAATPLGLKAMHDLQSLNPEKEIASNAQIMFLVINTAGLTLIPISIIMYRKELGAANPADVFIPILLITLFSATLSIIITGLVQKIQLLNATVILTFLGIFGFVGAMVWYFGRLSEAELNTQSGFVSSFVLISIVTLFVSWGAYKKINVYEAFIEGAKEGFQTAVGVIPYLIAVLVAVAVFRASGALTAITDGLAYLLTAIGINADFVPALPTAFMKPLSGSGARGLMLETMKTYGADSFVGRTVCVVQGSTDTTFYILAVYFGAVRIKNTRHALSCGLIADAIGVVGAILLAYLFFG